MKPHETARKELVFFVMIRVTSWIVSKALACAIRDEKFKLTIIVQVNG